jgi:UDP-glucose:(heptosyl)LPS alpha-1,3-glucosyltransferase
MRIALIRQRYNPFGGAERFLERALEALERQGAEVTLVTRAWRESDSRRVLVVDPPYAGRLWRDFSFSRAVRAAIHRDQFDIVQSHERIPGCDVYRAGDGVHRRWLDNRLEHAPMLERLGIKANPYHWYVCAAERSMFEHPDLRAVICNSNMVAAEIRRGFSISTDKVHVIYNGVDLDYFHPDQRKKLRAEARDKLGCRETDTLFSFVGSGFARKGLGVAIDALGIAGKPELKLAVAGKDRSTAKLAARARKAGVGDRVMFLGGVEDVRPLLAASDCFILPTRYDPFPNAALEALAMGIPIIVSDRCGAAEIVETGTNGWVCDPEAVAPLARLMVEAAATLTDDCLGEGARNTAEAFGLEKMTGQMTQLYETLAGTSKAGRRDH